MRTRPGAWDAATGSYGGAYASRVKHLGERFHGYDRREDFFKVPKPPEMEQESVSRLVRAIQQAEGKGKG